MPCQTIKTENKDNMYVQQFKDFLFLLGSESKELFDFFSVDELHGLKKSDCLKIKDSQYSSFIAGHCNFIPNKKNIYTKDSPYYIFINAKRLGNRYQDITLLNHECMHLSLFLHDYDVIKKEEIIVSYAENCTHLLVRTLINLGYVY